MVGLIVPDHGTAAQLSAIERAAFAGRETPWSINDYVALGGPPRAAVFTDDMVREGYLILSFAADEGEIINLGVVPSARRKGLGRALLMAGEDLTCDLGIRRLFLEVAADNAPARALYTSEGYAEAGRRKGYYRRPDGSREDALIMGKEL